MESWLYLAQDQQFDVPGGSDSKESNCNAGDMGSIPGSERSPGEENGYPPVFFPRESHGQRSLVGYSPWGLRELNTTECLRRHVNAYGSISLMITRTDT